MTMCYNYRNKEFRDFVLSYGLPDNEYGRTVTVKARSSMEAGAIINERGLIPRGYVAHDLIDPALEPRHKRQVVNPPRQLA